MKTKQEIFDEVVKGLASQGFKQSLLPEKDGGGCAYRGDHGRKCAVGHLIPDEKYSKAFEGDSVAEYNIQEVLKSEGYEDACFLDQLQHCHDSGHTPEGMRIRLRSEAERLGLTIPECLCS